jgi:stage II sporulation protein AB (anti-sigma F factor)
MKNSMKLEFCAYPANEGFARVAVAAFMAGLDPTVEQMEDVKTAVSEAVTNCIIHGYEMTKEKIQESSKGEAKQAPQIYMEMRIEDKTIHIAIRDEGVGIGNIAKAMEPLYTSKPELDRSGMGFAFMEAFMDDVKVESTEGCGTTVFLSKQID